MNQYVNQRFYSIENEQSVKRRQKHSYLALQRLRQVPGHIILENKMILNQCKKKEDFNRLSP